MSIPFFKYQGAGNDFILLDQRSEQYLDPKHTPAAIIRGVCDRHFGIGADGLILLESSSDADFQMVYFNSDGHQSTMCGNGGRCIVAFARDMGLIERETIFLAVDGIHRANIDGDRVELEMQPVSTIEAIDQDLFLDTGSPHYVKFVDQLSEVEVVPAARAIRYNDRFAQEGTNVNFVQIAGESLKIATYERGVEGETLACGTGVTAAALALASRKEWPAGQYEVPVVAKGGDLRVRFRWQNKRADQIWLIGPARLVFSGTISLSE